VRLNGQALHYWLLLLLGYVSAQVYVPLTVGVPLAKLGGVEIRWVANPDSTKSPFWSRACLAKDPQFHHAQFVYLDSQVPENYRAEYDIGTGVPLQYRPAAQKCSSPLSRGTAYAVQARGRAVSTFWPGLQLPYM
jgi:hypothetical protein